MCCAFLLLRPDILFVDLYQSNICFINYTKPDIKIIDNTAETPSLSQDPLTKIIKLFCRIFGYLISSVSGTSAYNVFQQLMM